MHQYPFIFSNERKYRLLRHITFWVSWWLFFTVLYSFSPIGFNVGYAKRLLISGIDAFFYLFSHIFLSYTLMYLVLPYFLLKGKYLMAAISTLALFFITAFLAALIGIYILNPAWKTVFADIFQRTPHINWVRFFNALLSGLRGAITIGGLAAAIKLMKHLYVKEQNNLTLQKQNIATQLQLLKAQVHPHFLFNTLNSIYAHTLVASPQAPRLVEGLSDMLRYMLYECNQPLVPLHKELKLLKDYMMLEQMRYDEGIDISMELPDDDHHLLIAPLLLLPFAENAFKHGASQMLEHPWVSLTIQLQDTTFKMKLVNGKAEKVHSGPSGIGIANVQQRLQLIYPERHELRIVQTEDAFVVNLKLQLTKPTAVSTAPQKSEMYE
jgi:sensor histidine kinase YesM